MVVSGNQVGELLIMGDLCVDVLLENANLDAATELAPGAEVTTRCASSISVGGSGWLLAHAAVQTRLFHPVVLGVVGGDLSGAYVLDAMSELGISTASITRAENFSTDLVCMISTPSQQRLMFTPTAPANNLLDEATVAGHLSSVDPARVRWTWISGYALADQSSARWRAAGFLAAWSRRHGIPVVLDLVPHEFRASVGTLADVSRYLGGFDILIGAPSTFIDFRSYDVANADELRRDISNIAVEVSRDWGTALVQTRTDLHTFGQAIGHRGRVLAVNDVAIPREGMRGMGDLLAVETLHWLGNRTDWP